jgi:SulP family sulfate permease
LLYAVFGSSRQLVVAVSSAIAITSAATIVLLAPQGTAEYVALTAALALLAGLISVVAGLLRLGRIASFFSTSVLLGFVFGLALIISLKQVPKILGLDVSDQNFFALLGKVVRDLGETSLPTLAVGAGCMAGMILLERFLPKLPAALIVLIGSIAASAWPDLYSRGVAVVGDLPSGLAPPKLPGAGLESVPLLFVGAAGIALLAFAEAMGPAQQFAKEHGYEVDANRELVAVGAANMGAGLFQRFPIGASLSKSAANDQAGAKTPASLLVAPAATALTAVFLTPLFRVLPESALGAIVIVAVSGMERIGPMARLWRLRRSDFAVAMVALLGVLIFDILPGLALALAVVVSLGMVVWRAAEARLELTGRTAKEPHTQTHTATPSPGLLTARPEQMMFFVNAAEVRNGHLGGCHRRRPQTRRRAGRPAAHPRP